MLNGFIRLSSNYLFMICLITSSCGNHESTVSKTESESIVINDYNIVIAPDLSNRINPKIHPKAVSDTILINELLDHAISFLDIKNRHMNQLDVYQFDFINNGILNNHIADPDSLKIDLRKFKNRGIDATNYIKTEMPKDIETFKDNVAKVYNYSLMHSSGADLWNYFNETINNSAINVSDEELPNDVGKKVIKRNQNIAILFTDGYIENTNRTRGYVLDEKIINNIRKDFLNSSSKDLKEFIYNHPEYQLNKTTNNLHGFNIMINELVDRSKDINGVALKQPTDFQIMKIVLEKWLRDSGALHVEVYDAVGNKELFIRRVRSFLENI